MMNRPRRPVEHDFSRRALVQHWIRGGTVRLQEQIQSLLKRCLLDSNFLQGPLEGIHDPLGLAVRLGMKRCSRDVFNAVSVAELLELLKFVKEEEDLLSEELGVNAILGASTVKPSRPNGESMRGSQRDERCPAPQLESVHRNVPTELSEFSGDPAEWPVFIAHYDYTTEKCGFSNWENMIRHHKTLKGPALEVVRSRLVLPEVVTQVIATLRSRYGRPEYRISALIEKVRRMPAPCREKPDTVVAFGEAVRSMVDHMRAAGLRAHLTNPLLL